jgi:hypothetical protein
MHWLLQITAVNKCKTAINVLQQQQEIALENVANYHEN